VIGKRSVNGKTILVNAVSAKSGGAASYVLNLAQQLANSSTVHRFIFYVPQGLSEAIGETHKNMAVIETSVGKGSAWKRFLWDQFVLRAILKRKNIDILVSSSDFGMNLPPCRQILLIRNSLFFSNLYARTFSMRQSWRCRLNRLVRRWLVLLSIRSSDVVITATHSLLEEVQRFINFRNKKAVVNPFGVPLQRFTPYVGNATQRDQEEPSKPFRILHVSEYSDYKNLTVLFKAVRTLSEQGFTNFRLVTTADPHQFPDDELVTRDEDQSLAIHSQVAPFLKLTGPVPYMDIPGLYRDSDLFVFPSISESFGHPLVEAMASGVPVIASDIPVCREICGEAAIYFDPFDEKSLAEAIVHLEKDITLRKKLSETGRCRAESQFNWTDHVRRLVNLIEEVGADA